LVQRLLTIGVYGFDEAGFFAAIERAGIDTFCDIRSRRGVRGARYAFANSTRLQAACRQRGIRYVHIKQLAPTAAVRGAQAAADAAAGIRKRDRTRLSDAFIQAYNAECLEGLDPGSVLAELGPDARAIVLFCVEGEPAVCHRSLAARRLAQHLGTSVEDLRP
jgi:uncharacterized protein (DUF488 family)